MRILYLTLLFCRFGSFPQLTASTGKGSIPCKSGRKAPAHQDYRRARLQRGHQTGCPKVGVRRWWSSTAQAGLLNQARPWPKQARVRSQGRRWRKTPLADAPLHRTRQPISAPPCRAASCNARRDHEVRLYPARRKPGWHAVGFGKTLLIALALFAVGGFVAVEGRGLANGRRAGLLRPKVQEGPVAMPKDAVSCVRFSMGIIGVLVSDSLSPMSQGAIVVRPLEDFTAIQFTCDVDHIGIFCLVSVAAGCGGLICRRSDGAITVFGVQRRGLPNTPASLAVA